jgi:hypothetical protein
VGQRDNGLVGRELEPTGGGIGIEGVIDGEVMLRMNMALSPFGLLTPRSTYRPSLVEVALGLFNQPTNRVHHPFGAAHRWLLVIANDRIPTTKRLSKGESL